MAHPLAQLPVTCSHRGDKLFAVGKAETSQVLLCDQAAP